MAADTGMKTFSSSALASASGVGEDQGVESKTMIDDIEVTFLQPGVDQIVLMTALLENSTSSIHAGANLINIFFSLIKDDEVAVNISGEEVDDEDYDGPVYTDYTSRRLQSKMMDRHDDFGIVVISDVMRWLLEEWSARPTTPSSPSSGSRAGRGSTSKATQRGPASTPGRSRR
jgi:hypothetical protein